MPMYNADFNIYHIDLYRINKVDELGELGFEEYLFDDRICFIEWADRAEVLLPDSRINVKMEFVKGKDNWRKIKIERK